MNQLRVRHHGEFVGSLAVPENFRLPASNRDIELWNSPTLTKAIYRSRSWLYDCRPGDFNFVRIEGPPEELIIEASPKLGPGDISLVEGFEASSPSHSRDDDMVNLADQVAAEHGLSRLGGQRGR